MYTFTFRRGATLLVKLLERFFRRGGRFNLKSSMNNTKRSSFESEGGDSVLESIKKFKRAEEGVEIPLPLDNTTSSADADKSKSSVNVDTGPQPQPSPIKYTQDGHFLRVDPYWFDYCSWAKGRWFNRSLVSVFQQEFRDRPAAYYSHACRAGLIRVNDSVVSEGYKVQQGDRIQHRIHRHEPPVLGVPEPEILHVGDGLLVVSKPPSIPMHPSGRYRHNTLTSLLLHRHPELFPTGHISCVNRLDRLVSGIVIISRSAEKADELRRAMQDMKFRKFYLARVQGQFDTLPTEKLFYATRRERVIDCVAPLLIVEHKIGLSCVADSTAHPSAKESQTRFIQLDYDPITDYSLILCEPVTGRTHQIRLHLQYLGFPIHNDPLYNNSFWRTLKSEVNKEESDSIYKSNDWIGKVKEMAQEMSKSSLFHQEDDLTNFSFSDSTALCPDCENPHPDPEPSTLKIDLHAYKYSGPMGSFSTALPNWAAGQTEELKLTETVLNAAEEAFSFSVNCDSDSDDK